MQNGADGGGHVLAVKNLIQVNPAIGRIGIIEAHAGRDVEAGAHADVQSRQAEELDRGVDAAVQAAVDADLRRRINVESGGVDAEADVVMPADVSTQFQPDLSEEWANREGSQRS